MTDYHEHLYVEPPAWLHKIDPDFALDSVEKSAAELKTFAEAGGRTLVELTAVDFGRNVGKIVAVADARAGGQRHHDRRLQPALLHGPLGLRGEPRPT